MLYDLLIVGGSAVGFYLAKEFSKKGNSVLVLGRDKKVEEKVCSGLVSKHIFNLLASFAVVATKAEQKSPEAIFGDHNNFIEKKFGKARIWTQNKYFDFPGQAWLFDRQKFDKYLFKKAKETGGEIKFEKEVIKVKEKKNFVEVVTKDGKDFQGRLLAGCDGVLSTVAREVGLPKQKNLLLGVITYIDRSKFQASQKVVPRSQDFPEIFFSKDFPGFFSWRIPRGNCIEYGIALEPEYKPKERLEKFLKSKIQVTSYPEAEPRRRISSLRGGQVPYGAGKLQNFRSALIPFYPLKKTTTKRVFLCGNAAGQIKPMTGGGLVYGLACAKIASETIDPREPELEIYEKEWRKKLMKEIYLGNILRKCYRLPNFIKETGLSLFQKRKKLDQDKPSTIFNF